MQQVVCGQEAGSSLLLQGSLSRLRIWGQPLAVGKHESASPDSQSFK